MKDFLLYAKVLPEMVISKGEWFNLSTGRTLQCDPGKNSKSFKLAKGLSMFSFVKATPYLLLDQVYFGPQVGILLKEQE